MRTALTHPDGTRTAYRRDGAGRVTGMTHPLLGPVDLERDPDGRLVAMTGPGARARWDHTDGWLTAYEGAGYEGAGSTRLTRDEHGRVVAADTDGRTRLFGYDAAGQLVGAASSDGDRTYTYDPAGRLVDETGPDGRRRYRHDAAGRLVASTGPDGPRLYRHDDVGRRTTEEGERERRDYRWDPFGRLAGIDTTDDDGHARSVELRVDALGELARVDDVPLTWDTADPFAPLVAIGAQAGFGPPWAVDPPIDGNDPWGGDTAAPAGLGVGYRGELAVDGLVWLRERVYDPTTRAFLQPDPLPAVPGTAYAANAYHYAGNDPVNSVDPLGLRPITDAQLEGHRDSGGGLFSKIGHGVLDVAGLVPGVGAVADVVNAGWYAYEGDYTMAALSLATAIPVFGAGALAAKTALKGGRALEGAVTAEKLTAETVVDGAQGLARRPDFIANADGVVIPTSRARLETGFQEAGFPAAPTPRSPGTEYTLPGGTHVRVMEPAGQAPLRASFPNANGGPVGAFTDKPVQPPPGLGKADRLDYIRQRTHVELGP